LYNKLEELFKVERYGDAAKSAQNIHVANAAAVERKADVEKGCVSITFCHILNLFYSTFFCIFYSAM